MTSLLNRAITYLAILAGVAFISFITVFMLSAFANKPETYSYLLNQWSALKLALFILPIFLVLLLSYFAFMAVMKFRSDIYNMGEIGKEKELYEQRNRQRYDKEWAHRVEIEKYKLAFDFLKYSQGLDCSKQPNTDLLTDDSINQLNKFISSHLQMLNAEVLKSTGNNPSVNPSQVES